MEAKIKLEIPSPLIELNHPLFAEKDVTVMVKRDDLIHPEISGNKWRKLHLNIEKYYDKGYAKLLTFGGAYSNHIAATALVGKLMGIPTIGIIRGDELNANSNATIAEANANGMELVFVSRSEYGMRYENDYKNELRARYGHVLIIEEGGANYLGAMGCTEIISEVDQNFDGIYLASGTGTTTTGILLASGNAKVYSVPVLKNGGFIKDAVRELLIYSGTPDELMDDYFEKLTVLTDYHFGGYGKYTYELLQFMGDVYATTGLKLDQVYTAKALFALFDAVKKNQWGRGAKILFIHTGGLQGIRSVEAMLNYSLD